MFDSHCHLTDPQFAGEVSAVVARARAAGVRGIVTIASDAADAERALLLAAQYPDVWSTAGVHPHAAGAASAADLERVRALVQEERVVGVGETGLDYYYDNSPRDVQRARFAWHLELAAATGKPAIVHSRDADADTAAMIRGGAGAAGILHCFSGGASLLEAGLDAGWYISFAGPVTFKRFEAQALLCAVPADRLLLETDSPYLAPVPYRGKRNEPAFVVHTCEAAARWRGEDPAELARMVERNARRCYGIGSSTGEH